MVAPVVPFVLGDIGWLMAGIASYFLGKEAVDAVDALDQPTEDQTPQKDPDKGLLPVPTPPYTRLENIRKDHDQDTSCRPDHEVAAFLRRAFPDLTAPHTPESLLALVHLCGRTAEAEGYPGRTCLFYWSVRGPTRPCPDGSARQITPSHDHHQETDIMTTVIPFTFVSGRFGPPILGLEDYAAAV